MKNLMIYINPKKEFNKEHKLLAKIQIDNSLDLDWDKKDIILITNFKYEYRQIKALVVPDLNYCDFRPLSTKTVTVDFMLKNNLIANNEIYWVHDFDAYQDAPLTEKILNKSVAFSDYGYSSKPSLGSYFFTSKAKKFFSLLKKTIYLLRQEDERALNYLIKNEKLDYQKINISYNFGMRKVEENYKRATKPLKVLHFHLWGKDLPTLNIFMHGNNKLKSPLMSRRLIKIFNKYGIR